MAINVRRDSCFGGLSAPNPPKSGGDQTCKILLGMLSRCRSYQFHDTSSAAGIRKSGYIENAGYLRSDAGNLAAYLCALQKTYPDCYERIVDTVRLVFPSFGDFFSEPSPTNENYILLN
ncbi:MAG: hypothetical protein B1H11_11605 [Desulfobacteraceae bacterium 4484_190.1]|nr:MAG: hypothetical protein B1H11_11605 [Desulfobacteraceae bacterium 4484_190.1]